MRAHIECRPSSGITAVTALLAAVVVVANWQLTAVVCGYPQLFEGLERVAKRVSSGAADETHVEASCPAGKRPIVAESFRNTGVSAPVHYSYIVCTNS